MATGKTNNPEGINQYTKNAKSSLKYIENIGNRVKLSTNKAFEKTSEKVKTGWEAIDKTVKYGAAGAAAGALGVGLGSAGSFAAKRVSLPKSTAAFGAAGGISGATLGNTVSYPGQTKKERRNIIAASAGGGVVLGALSNAVPVVGMRLLGAPTPAKVAAGAVVGGAIGAYKGYKKDREEAAAKKK